MRRGHPVGTSSRPCLVPGSIETQEGVFLHGLLCFPSRPRVTLMPSEESIRFMFFLLKSGVFAVEIRIPSSLEALCTVVAVVLNRQLAVPVPNQPMQLLKCSARCHIQDKKPPDQPPNDSQSQYVRQHKYKQGKTKPGRKCVLGGRGCAIKFQTLARLLKFQSLKSGNNQRQNCRQTKSERKASKKENNGKEIAIR